MLNNQAAASYPAQRALSRTEAGARVDRQGAPGIVRRLRDPALRLSAKSPCGGTGRRARLKIEFRKECWFDSGQGHQGLVRTRPPMSNLASNDGTKRLFDVRGRPRLSVGIRRFCWY